MFRDPVLSASLAMSALVSTVMMATLVVGPFYLSRALGLDAALVGIVMSIGPIISALSGVPAGRIVDRLGAPFMVIVGLIAMAAGSIALSVLPATFGIAGYIAAIAVLTPGYQLFQAANNTAVMTDVRPDQRGVMSGMLNLSRNLGLITGASVMGAVFALASATIDITTARPEAVATGMRITFAVAAIPDRRRARHRGWNLPPHIAQSGTCSGSEGAGGQERFGMIWRPAANACRDYHRPCLRSHSSATSPMVLAAPSLIHCMKPGRIRSRPRIAASGSGAHFGCSGSRRSPACSA